MAYELWDTESRNVVGEYETEDEALAVVRHAIDRDGPGAADSLMLAFEDRTGRSRMIASGAELADRARVAAPAEAPTH
jgi:hypothetical protein